MDRRDDLAEFLRSRRAAVDPTDVGLPGGGRRRAPGLRREEVALLAGVSVTWYTWLEQGRPINASRQVLEALARTLLLDDAETAHLLVLADPEGAAAATGVDLRPVPDALLRLLAALDPAPAYVLGPRWEYLAWNQAQQRLFPSAAELDEAERNLLAIVCTDPSARALIVDWEDEVGHQVAWFRADTAPIRSDPEVVALVERLTASSPTFRQAWERHDVSGFRSRLRRYQHPTAGRLTFEYQQLTPSDLPEHRVVAQLGLAGDDSVERLGAVEAPGA